MPLILQATVFKVTLGGKEITDKESGEVRKTDPVVYLINEASFDSEAKVETESLKCKDNLQAEAFRRLIGREISVPVNVWTMGGKDKTASTGFWLSAGVLPTAIGAKDDVKKA